MQSIVIFWKSMAQLRKKNPFDTNYRAMSKNETKRQLKTLENQTSQPDR